MEYFHRDLLLTRISKLEKRKETLLTSGTLDIEFVGRLARMDREMNMLYELSIQLCCLSKRRRVEMDE